jgi:hypothetical protein
MLVKRSQQKDTMNTTKSKTFRLSATATTVVENLSEETGWNSTKSAEMLIEAGYAAARGGNGELVRVQAIKELIAASVGHHEVEKLAARNLARTRATVRRASRNLKVSKEK